MLVIVATLYRGIFLLFEGSFLIAGGWVLASMLILWIVLGFKYNKDIPGVGPYRYEEGTNQIGRGIYSGAMTIVFVIACIHG